MAEGERSTDPKAMLPVPAGNVAILFTQFGPYHHARVRALQNALPGRVIPAQIAMHSSTYAWTCNQQVCDGLVTLCTGNAEDASPVSVFMAACRFFKREKIRFVFLPSYSPASVFALYLAAIACGCRRIMMNESHAGTERATGWKRYLKQLIVRQFHAALVGGSPQKRHFHSLGIPKEKIFLGYDAIDNHYFSDAAALARDYGPMRRVELGLPDRYFLNLGRFVEKKDLGTLIRAYALFRQRSTEPVELVLVGSGAQEDELKRLSRSLGLAVRGPAHDEPMSEIAKINHPNPESTRLSVPAVYFMGFQQISANPSFYALADAFILPSVVEEWGLVVNEAMACGLPVIVSRAVGCAEDLVADRVNGFLFAPGDIPSLVDILTRLAHDPTLRTRMGEVSSERISKWDCNNFASNALLAISAAG